MKFVELFAGIGGFRYGLERVQLEDKGLRPPTSTNGDKKRQPIELDNRSAKRLFNCVWANDNNKYACQIYRKNFGGKELYEGDIKTVETRLIPNHDLLTAGFPCQAFSIAGKRKGFDDTRGTLFFEIARICRAKKPRYILLENVKGLLNHESGQTFQTILKVLSDIGYVLQWEVLNSKNFGIPQNRERVFIVGHLRGTPKPEVFPLGENDKVYSRENEPNKRRTQAEVSHALKGANIKADSSFILEDFYPGRVREFKESPSIRSGRYQLKVNQGMKIRRLTPIECERLQGFPDNYTEEVSDTQRYKCLGNAVTTNVIEAIGRKLCLSFL